MPSNRSRKDVFKKEADDTLRRQLISPEFQKLIALMITGETAHNGADALRLTSSHPKYAELEGYYNKRLASYITYLRYDIHNKVEKKDYDISDVDGSFDINFGTECSNLPVTTTQPVKTAEERHDESKLRELKRTIKIIPRHNFEAYWNDVFALSEKLEEYRKLISEYDDCNVHSSVTKYIEAVYILVQSKHGSPLPILPINKREYDIVLKVYSEHKDRGLEFPGWPKEHLISYIIK